MDNSLFLGLSAQRALERRLAITANNLANADTTGFKADMAMFRPAKAGEARAEDRPTDIRYVRDVGVARDFTTGPIERTGGPLDLAIDGDGFFAVQGEEGTLYTRDGAFQLNPDGVLVTKEGRPVLSEAGAPIVLDPRGQSPTVDSEGNLRVGAANVGRIQVAAFAAPETLRKVGENLFAPEGQPTIEATGRLVQGALEGSNVNAITELTRLIEVSRAYEGATRIVRAADDLRQRAIERLGRVS